MHADHVVATGQFASSFVGTFLVPLLVIITGTILVDVWVDGRKKLKILDAIIREVLPNGGGSLRDSVTRTEKKTNDVSKKLKKHLAVASVNQAKVEEMYDAHRERLDAEARK